MYAWHVMYVCVHVCVEENLYMFACIVIKLMYVCNVV